MRRQTEAVNTAAAPQGVGETETQLRVKTAEYWLQLITIEKAFKNEIKQLKRSLEFAKACVLRTQKIDTVQAGCLSISYSFALHFKRHRDSYYDELSLADCA